MEQENNQINQMIEVNLDELKKKTRHKEDIINAARELG